MSETKKKVFSLKQELVKLAGLSVSELQKYISSPEDEAIVINPSTREYRGVIVAVNKRGVKIIVDTFLGAVFAALGEKVIMQKMPDELISNMNTIYQDNFTASDDYVTLSGGKI